MIRVRVRELNDNILSLYLHAQYDGRQEQETLNLYIIGKGATKKEDEENLRLAIAFRDEKENRLIQNRHNFRLKDEELKTDFLDYYQHVVTEKNNGDANWKNTENHLRKFIDKKSIGLKNIDPAFCKKFYQFLLENVNQNSAWQYYSRFKSILNQAVETGIFRENPARHVSPKKVEVEKVFLLFEEIKLLDKIPSPHEHLKNGFLFSCWTGLRLSDIEKLKWSEIQDNYLVFRQKKTKGVERMKLHKNALNILENQKLISDQSNVFQMPQRATGQRILRDWIRSSGIKKNVTFHSARHTYATLLLTFGVDIYTVSKLLGHKDIKTTQVYAKLIDLKKDEAVDRLPEI